MAVHTRWRRIGEIAGQTAGIAVVAVLLALLLYVWLVRPWQYQRDVDGAPERHGVAVVESVTFRQATRGNPDPSPAILVRMDNRVYEGTSRDLLRRGQRVAVDYRVGHSGTVYVDRLAPLTRGAAP